MTLYLGSPLSLCQVNVSWEFLRATSTFWDSERDAFYFKGHGFCPLIEEFYASIGFFLYCPPIFSFVSKDVSSPYSRVLGLSKEVSLLYSMGMR